MNEIIRILNMFKPTLHLISLIFPLCASASQWLNSKSPVSEYLIWSTSKSCKNRLIHEFFVNELTDALWLSWKKLFFAYMIHIKGFSAIEECHDWCLLGARVLQDCQDFVILLQRSFRSLLYLVLHNTPIYFETLFFFPLEKCLLVLSLF